MIAEDEDVVRDALVDLVSSDDRMEVVASAADADEAIRVAEETQPDVALVDVKMPGGGGPVAAREIRRRSPHTHVVALSAYEDRSTVLEMLRAGVVGYIVKGTPADEILDTICRSVQGQGSLSVEVTADVIHELALLLERSEGLSRELEELDRTKSEFIQILSHELFTPITAIQGFAATVAGHEGNLPIHEMRAMADGVARASDRIRRLVGNLAAAARLDMEGVEIRTGPMNVTRLLSGAAAEFKSHQERIGFPEDASTLDTKIRADQALATRALVAVIENALELSPEGSEVEILVSTDEGFAAVSVLDRGPGIPEEVRQHLFEAFTQADASTTRTHQGLGVGLYLAKRIMSAHSGRIDVQTRDGGGSEFRLSFPVSTPDQFAGP
jgi:signal transduction histidine kinase